MANKGKGLGLLSGLFWGLDSVIIGVALATPLLLSIGNSASLLTTFFRDSFSFLMLIAFLLVRKQGKSFLKVLFSKSGLSIVIAALLGGPLGMSAYVLSIDYLGPSLSSSISAIYPVFGIILAYIFLKEKIKLHSVIGILISIVAIILMSMGSIDTSDKAFLGIILVLICAMSWGSEAVIINAALKEDVPSEIALTIRQMVTSLTYAFIIIPFIGYDKVYTIFNNQDVLIIMLLSAFAGTLSYLAYYRAIDLIGSTQAMGLNITYPAWAFIFQYFVDKTFDPYMFILSIIIMIGALLSNDNPKEFFQLFSK